MYTNNLEFFPLIILLVGIIFMFSGILLRHYTLSKRIENHSKIIFISATFTTILTLPYIYIFTEGMHTDIFRFTLLVLLSIVISFSLFTLNIGKSKEIKLTAILTILVAISTFIYTILIF